MNDQDVRTKALSINESFIVQAPAGSGKTGLLTQRFLKLLAYVEREPEEILAVTFTRKAASEMRQRIIEALMLAKNHEEPKNPHDLLTFNLAALALNKNDKMGWQLIENPNRLRIMTIDALCSSLVSRMPILTQFGAKPEISQSTDTDYRQAVEMLIQEASLNQAWQGALQCLLEHLDNRIETIINLLVEMLKKRDQWLPYLMTIKHSEHDFIGYLSFVLEKIVEQQIARIPEIFNEDFCKKLQSVAGQADDYCQMYHVPSPWQSLADNYLYDLTTENIDVILALADRMLTQKGEYRQRVTKNDGFPAPSDTKDKIEKAKRQQHKANYLELLQVLVPFEECLDFLKNVQLLPPLRLKDTQSQVLSALAELLPLLVGFLKIIYQQTGKVDFTEVTLRALDGLGDESMPSDLILSLDLRLKHVLIDEYQDTSVTQYRLFEKLLMGWEPQDGRTLFLVGDPMQSIYRFRGAEVSLFLKTQREGIANIRCQPLTLQMNFRSEHGLIDWINQVCEPLFPRTAQLHLGGVPYSVAHAVKESQTKQNIFIYPSLIESQSQAHCVVTIVKDVLKNSPEQSIAILVKAKSHLRDIVIDLQKNDLQYVAHELDLLCERSYIIDALSLIKAQLDLTDTIAWYALLRAPWIGLRLNDLILLKEHNQTGILLDSLLQFDDIENLSPDAKQRLRRVVPILWHWQKNLFRRPLSEWFRGLWNSLGACHCYSDCFLLEDMKQFYILIEEHAIQNAVDLPMLEQKLTELYGAGASQEDCQIELMTIHKSKGLEFDTVIIPHLERTTNKTSQDLLLWYEHLDEEGVNILLAPRRAHIERQDQLYQYVLNQINKKDEYELTRLLYVAMTRAKKSLHLLASVSKNAEGEIQEPRKASLLSLLWPAVSPHFQPLKTNNEEELNKEQAVTSDASVRMKRLVSDWPCPPLVQKKLADVMSDQEDDLNHPESCDTFLKVCGIVFHRLMQYQVTAKGIDESFKKIIAINCLQEGLSSRQSEHATNLIVQAVQNMLSDSKGQWLLSDSHQEKHFEWSVSRKGKQGIENSVIDYAFVDENGHRWIIDYKFSHHQQYTESMIEDVRQQYFPQLKRYKNLTSQIESRTINCALYFPMAKLWVEME